MPGESTSPTDRLSVRLPFQGFLTPFEMTT
jgi:hypothetical protein